MDAPGEHRRVKKVRALVSLNLGAGQEAARTGQQQDQSERIPTQRRDCRAAGCGTRGPDLGRGKHQRSSSARERKCSSDPGFANASVFFTGSPWIVSRTAISVILPEIVRGM